LKEYETVFCCKLEDKTETLQLKSNKPLLFKLQERDIHLKLYRINICLDVERKKAIFLDCHNSNVTPVVGSEVFWSEAANYLQKSAGDIKKSCLN
jgi:hypothetical protein